MQFRLRTLLILMTLAAVMAGIGGPSVARVIREYSNPKPLFDEDDYRDILDKWEREWKGDAPPNGPSVKRGGII